MARATTGGRTRVGGGRRPCRRLLPALFLMATLVPQPVAGASGADAWLSARQLQTSHSATITLAAKKYASDSSERSLRDLRIAVFRAVTALDRLEVHDCFRVWWSYVRTSYVMFDQALAAVAANDARQFRSATSASIYLGAMADATVVQCSKADDAFAVDAAVPRGPGAALASAFDLPAG